MRYRVSHTIDPKVQILPVLQSITSMPLYESSPISHFPPNRKQIWWRIFFKFLFFVPNSGGDRTWKNGRHKKEQLTPPHAHTYIETIIKNFGLW